MKAIQIKVLQATQTKPARLKVWAEQCKPLIESKDYEFSVSEQALILAKQYADSFGWRLNVVAGVGQLPNGDYCALLTSKAVK